MKPLALLEAGPLDVICARGKKALEHSGNLRYKTLIEENLEEYSKCDTKFEKSLIVTKVIEAVREASPNGGFIKKVDGVWYDVGDHLAREKTGQSFRDSLYTHYKSSTKAKQARRKQIINQTDLDVTVLRQDDKVANQMQHLAKAAQCASQEDMLALLSKANQALLQSFKRDSPLPTEDVPGLPQARRSSIEPLNLETPARQAKRRRSTLDPLDLEVSVTNFVRGISAMSFLLEENREDSDNVPVSKRSKTRRTSIESLSSTTANRRQSSLSHLLLDAVGDLDALVLPPALEIRVSSAFFELFASS